MNARLVQIDDELMQVEKRAGQTKQTLEAGREFWLKELRKRPVRKALNNSTKMALNAG